jgi:hypothetical protein
MPEAKIVNRRPPRISGNVKHHRQMKKRFSRTILVSVFVTMAATSCGPTMAPATPTALPSASTFPENLDFSGNGSTILHVTTGHILTGLGDGRGVYRVESDNMAFGYGTSSFIAEFGFESNGQSYQVAITAELGAARVPSPGKAYLGNFTITTGDDVTDDFQPNLQAPNNTPIAINSDLVSGTISTGLSPPPYTPSPLEASFAPLPSIDHVAGTWRCG